MRGSNQWRYQLGTATSSFGDGVQSIAITWLILQWTGSPLAISGMIAVTYLPALLLAPWAGVYADHRDAKRLSVLLDVLRTVSVALMAVLAFLQVEMLALFYLLQGGLAVCNTMFKPASQALVKETFESDELVNVLTRSSSINLSATFVGAGLAPLLIAAVSPALCFAVNAASFLVSALCNGSLHRVLKRVHMTASYSVRDDLRAGWSFLRGKPGMLYLLLLSVVSSAGLQMSNTALAPYAAHTLQGGSWLYAVLDIAFTLGGVLAGIAVSHSLRKWGNLTCVISLAGMGAFAVLAGLRPSVWWVVLMIFGLGFFIMYHLVTMHTLLQVNTPKEIIGCVVGLRSIVASATKIASTLAAGFFLEIVDIQWVFWSFAGLVALTLLSAPKIKGIPVPASKKALGS